MWIAINTDDMSLAFKHHDCNTLNNLAFISLYKVSYTTFSIDTHDPERYTIFDEQQLKTLYQNITGSKWKYFNYKALLQVMYELMIEAPENNVNISLANTQASTITEKHREKDGVLLYARGKQRAKLGTDYPRITATIAQSIIDSALAGKQPSLKRIINKPDANDEYKLKPVIVKPKKKDVTVKRIQGATTLKDTIWEAAGKEWERLGQPLDVGTLNIMKKQVENKLVEKGINRGTANVQLNKWKKNILLAPTS